MICLVASGLSLAVHQKAESNRWRQAAIDSRAYALANPAPIPQVATPAPPYADSAHEMLSYATSDWPRALSTLETATFAGESITALDINPAERWVRVDIESTDYDHLLQYVNDLNSQTPSVEWSVVQIRAPDSTTHAIGPALVGTLKAVW